MHVIAEIFIECTRRSIYNSMATRNPRAFPSIKAQHFQGSQGPLTIVDFLAAYRP